MEIAEGSTGGERHQTRDAPAGVIDASAGDFEALQKLSSTMDAASVARLNVQQLDPRHPTDLAELTLRPATLPGKAVVHGAELQPATVFMMPEDARTTIAGECLTLGHPAAPREHRQQAGTLIESVTRENGGFGLAIIPSGAGDHCPNGPRALRAADGYGERIEPTRRRTGACLAR